MTRALTTTCLVATTLAALLGLSGPAAAAKTKCGDSICVKFMHKNHPHYVRGRILEPAITHFNVVIQGAGVANRGEQFETGGEFTFPRVVGKTIISIQSCVRYVVGPSRCQPWSTISYRVRDPD
jgi:hypothetical protein